MDLELKDKMAIVGGGSKGRGRACALVLAEEGAEVAVSSRSKADLDGATQAIRDASGTEVLAFADATLCHGDGAHGRGDRRLRALMLTILTAIHGHLISALFFERL